MELAAFTLAMACRVPAAVKGGAMTREAGPLVTIGISTYNRADGYLREALESALAQAYPNLEIVVSDNCSSDGTEKLVKSYDDPRIRYFRQRENIGSNNNFNFCLEQARGDYFLLLHDDDKIDPDMIEACMAAAGGDTSIGLIRTGTRVIDGGGEVLRDRRNRAGGLSTTDFFLGWFEGKTELYLCSTLFNTAQLREVGGFRSKTNLYDDVVAEVRLAAAHGRHDVEAVKASFRRHGANKGTAALIRAWCDDSLFMLDTMCELAPERKEEVRRRGLAFLCSQNYKRLARSPSRRWRDYLYIYRRFRYAYSPLTFFYKQYKRRSQRRLRPARPGFGRGTQPT